MTPYVGQIICVGFNFAPAGWAFCDGSLLPISQYDVLFNLIGTTFGGDGQTTFALPDLRGRTPIGTGQGGGLSNYTLGQRGGVEQVTLTTQQYPTHTHPLVATANGGNANAPAGSYLAAGQSVYTPNTPQAADALNASTVSTAPGSNQPHSNLQPYLTCNWVISLFGVYPSQS
jgi:microcystin-dependent protein